MSRRAGWPLSNRTPDPTSGRNAGPRPLRSARTAVARAAKLAAAAVTVMSATVAVTNAAVPVASAAPAVTPGAGAPFDCSGSTIYSVSFGLTQDLNAVDPSTGAETLISSISPTLGEPNGVGITPDGLDAFYTDDENASKVYDYNALAQTITAYTSASPNVGKVVAGGVDPANGIYYYAQFLNNVATVYGFNTATKTAIIGVIGTINLPLQSTGNNFYGDFAFDSAGNLFLIEGSSSAGALAVVNGPLPTTGADASLTARTIAQDLSSPNQQFNGIAFNGLGQLYVESGPGASPTASSRLFQIDPSSGTKLAGPVALNLPNTDLAGCFNATAAARANVVHRFTPTDQFDLSVTGTGVTQDNTATTSGTAVGLQAAEAGPVTALIGDIYTFAESGAAGTSLANYAPTYSCVDSVNGNALASGAGASVALVVARPPLTQTGEIGPRVVCTFTNSPRAHLSLTKALGAARVGSSDQFTVALHTGGASGPVVNSTTNSTTAGSGPTVTAGSGTTGTYLATPGATYTLTEAAAGTTVLSGYSAALTCTDANGVQTGLPTKAAFSGSAAITPVAGADVACILTNTAKTATAEPSLGITKSASPSVITAAGQVVTYTVVATNTGNVTLNDVEVTDTLAAPAGPPIVLTCNPTLPATLAPGATVTCTGSYVATASDLSHGDISNTATVTGHSPSGVLVDKSASATVTTEAATALATSDSPGATTTLAVTGFPLEPTVGVAAILIATGVGVVAGTRRRRPKAGRS